MMKRMLDKILKGYGREITLCRAGEEIAVYGFFQPDTGRTDRLSVVQAGHLGREDRMRYSYYGPAEYPVEDGDELVADGKSYLVRSGQVQYAGETPVYCWGLCVEKGGEDLWGLNG